MNLSLGAWLRPHAIRWHRAAQGIGSLLIAGATVLLMMAFVIEPRLMLLQSPYTPWAIYAITAGVIVHVIASSR